MDEFDFLEFVRAIRDLETPVRRQRVADEARRLAPMVVREPALKFRQQVYLQRVARLLKHLDGTDVSAQLTPSEKEAYTLLGTQSGAAVPAAAAAAAAAPQPAPTPQAAASQPRGAERRTSVRIQMKTRARICRESLEESEVVDPVNVSRGGVSFESDDVYELQERLIVDMHFHPEQPETERLRQRGRIVRRVPAKSAKLFSYGLKFD